MKLATFSSRTVGVFALLATAVTALHAQPDPAAMARLEALRQSPDLAGTAIYRGMVYAQQPADGKALFNYDRRVATTPSGLSGSHITRDPTGAVIIAEEARFSPAYALQRLDVANQQQGFSGSVVVSNDGKHLEYRLSQNGKVTTASEDLTEPAVAGPSLYGFVLQHWDALAGGQAVPLRMIVLAEKTSYGFVIRRLPGAEATTSFSITPSSVFVRLAIAPLKLTFDTKSRALVSYEGRVPPMQTDGSKLKTLDARIDYTMLAPAHR